MIRSAVDQVWTKTQDAPVLARPAAVMVEAAGVQRPTQACGARGVDVVTVGVSRRARTAVSVRGGLLVDPVWTARRFYSPALIVAAMRRKPRGYVAGSDVLAAMLVVLLTGTSVGFCVGVAASAFWRARDAKAPAPCHCMPEMEVRR